MIRVLLADDHSIMREGLKALLEKDRQIQVVATVADGIEALKQAVSLRPEIAVLDLTMPGLNGIELTHRLRSECPETRSIILSMHADRHLVLESLRAGARAYVLKDNAFDHLRKAIAMVIRGGAYLSPDVTTLLVDAVVHPSADTGQTPFEVLSAREREVLQLISEGKRTKEIADALFVSQKTVETHRKRIMDKLNLHSVAELTKYSVRHGITDIQ